MASASRSRLSAARPAVDVVQHLDAELLEIVGIRLRREIVVRHEDHVRAELAQQPDDVHVAVRAGVAVGLGHVVVDHDDDALALQPAHGARRRGGVVREVLRLEHVGPLAPELRQVEHLVPLDARAGIRAAGAAFAVNDDRARLIDHAEARAPHGEAQIAVLVVRRREALVEAAQLLEQRAPHEQRRAGAVVDVAHVLVCGIVRAGRRGRSSSPLASRQINPPASCSVPSG